MGPHMGGAGDEGGTYAEGETKFKGDTLAKAIRGEE